MEVRRCSLVKFASVVIYTLLASTASSSAVPTSTGNEPTSEERASIYYSDGSDVPIEQPLLKATDWFLTEQEITDSRGGERRKDLSVYTTGNAITSYTVTKDYFDAVYDDLAAVGEGQRVLLAAWDAKIVPFKPDVDVTGATTGYDKVVAGVVERGGEVSILAWANLMRHGHVIDARNNISSIPPSKKNGGHVTFIFDDRVRTISSSHHQKSLVIAAKKSTGVDDHPVAYVGGLDITNDRWDTIYHNNSALRDASGITFQYKGWADGEFRIHGPAAKDVANNFIARWNSDYKPCKGLDDTFLDFKNPDFHDLDRLDYASSKNTSKLGTQNVQIVRTYSCKYKHYKEFAPKGETSLLQARIMAIKNARNYIYIEDQYFILVPELLDALMEAMPRLQKVIIVAQAPVGQVTFAGYKKYFHEMVSPLKRKYPNKFHVYTTKLDLEIYIHSKIVIIDDVYLSVGSANWNRRSMSSDSELNANVVDDATIKSPDGIIVNKLARDFRIRKFHEFTGVSYAELDAMTFLKAARQFEIAAADNSSLIQTLESEYELYYIGITDLVRQQVDPEDICT
ncbi:PhosphoLipase D [Phytophthora megakarya]|uniref:phospholipase D n=1 Tax=Phytophthora megakarya TaxID=4795 RepID=A0A225V4E6_9STRA|nr:PhosphoLipase D [Phytophthora megakarya]